MGPLGWSILVFVIVVVLALAGSKLARRSLGVVAVIVAAAAFAIWLFMPVT